MVDTHICSFCGETVEPGTGKMFVRKDGAIFYFCSTKCQNNYRLGRVPRLVAWTKTGRKAKGRE
ncbi:MAG: 50S ribosomal protein L24e [Methanomicrobiales archaeon]|jgi:large subunit ribosomal protein L24e|nr:50S ribosomal protein L24e [Methanomicrobiales archaeon]